MFPLSRRRFLRLFLAGGSASLFSRCQPAPIRPIPGSIVNPAIPGHLLRQQHAAFPPPQGPRYDVAIIGGGLSGLCAAWKLQQAGVERLLLLELGEEPGGTAIAGALEGVVFPWGAHYINIPPAEADCVHELLQDLGVITGYDLAGRPQVAPQHLLRWPHERLFVDGGWVEDLDPFAQAPARQVELLHQFEDEMLRWTLYRGRDGRRAFALPLRYSSRDSAVRELDRLTMQEYLRGRGWDADRLDWLVDYACRDDYGTPLDETSAWAGIHYFACRFYDRRLRDQYPSDTLTWPEGNAFLVERLAEPLAPQQRRLHSAVLRVEPDQGEVRLGCADCHSGELFSLRARCAIYAGKLHAVPYVVQGLPQPQRRAMEALRYCAWLVAAIRVSRLPRSQGAPLAWDNVFFASPSLGYVAAEHQRAGPYREGPRVLIYHLPLVRQVEEARRDLLDRDHRFWTGRIVAELRQAHPDIEEVIERIDLYRWGHAMVQPLPGVIWGADSAWRERSCGGVSFATCDTTGLPLFEEACFAGIRAAEECLARLGLAFSTSLKGLGSG